MIEIQRRLIATLGTSPGGVFESYRFLKESGIDIKEVYLLVTKEPAVQFSAELVKKQFSCIAPEVKPTLVDLGIVDIEGRSDFKRVQDVTEKLITSADFVDLTGGIKAISVALALMAQEKGTTLLTTIIPSDEYRRINDLVAKLKEKKELTCDDVKALISEKARTVIL